MIKILLFVCFNLLTLPARGDEPFEKFRVQAGEHIDIAAPAKTQLLLSQSRILEVQDRGQGRFRLLGMKAGLVHIKAETEDGHLQKSWLIEVLPRDPDAQWLGKERWRSYFCLGGEIRCDEKSSAISGQTDDLLWFHEARDLCRKKAPCQWQVKLSQRGQELWREKIRAFAPHEELQINADATVFLETRCEENRNHSELRKTLLETFGLALQLICQSGGVESWYLDVLAVAVRKGQTDLSNPLVWKFPDLPGDKPIEAAIEGLSSADHVKILAQPEILISSGSSISLADGMEMQTALPQRDTTEILWKPLGFRLDLTLLEVREGKARVRLALRLSRARASQRSVDASELKTEAWIPIGQLYLVGKIAASMENQDEARIPWLSAIPWLGELFTWTNEGQVKSDVQLLLRLRSQKEGIFSAEVESEKAGWSEKE